MRRRLTGLAALIGIVAILGGVPALLLSLVGPPWPSGVTTGAITGALLSPDDGTALVVILTYVAWIAWLSFAAMIVLEAAGRIRGVRVPQLPGLRVQQRAAAGLVAAVALLFSAAGIATIGTSAPADAASQATTSQTSVASTPTTTPSTAAPAATSSTATTAGVHADDQQAGPQHRVRAGETLWSIAEDHLGDGARFPEIARLNYGHVQADGGSLDSSHWLRAGWTLTLPADADAPANSGTAGSGGEVTVEPGDTLSQIAEEQLGDADAYPQLVEASQDITQPDGRHLEDPDLIYPGWHIDVPHAGNVSTRRQAGETPAPTPQPAPEQHASPQPDADGQQNDQAPEAGGSTAAPDQTREQTPEQAPAQPPVNAPAGQDQSGQGQGQPDGSASTSTAEEDDGFPVRTIGGVGMLLAAGVLGVVAARRRRQQQRRQPGQALPVPEESAEAVERELRATADPLSVETVDIALRTLARQCALHEQPLPQVRAARLTAEAFELYLAEPAQLPAPFTGQDEGGSVWSLPADTPVEELLPAVDAAHVTAPYPSLVTIGHDEEDGTVMVDLEYLGTLGVDGGNPEQTRFTLAALAVEIATSRWADDAQLTFVGAYSELAQALGTGRVRYLPTLGHLLEQLQTRADHDREQLRQTSGGDLAHARVTGEAEDAWTPEIVVMVGDPTAEQADQLRRLVSELPRVAIAAVTGGAALGDWSVELTGAQDAVLHPIELPLRPQQLDDATYGQILEVLAVADEDSTDPAWSDDEPRLGDLFHIGDTAESNQVPAAEDATEPAPYDGDVAAVAAPAPLVAVTDNPTAEDQVDDESDQGAAQEAGERPLVTVPLASGSITPTVSVRIDTGSTAAASADIDGDTADDVAPAPASAAVDSGDDVVAVDEPSAGVDEPEVPDQPAPVAARAQMPATPWVQLLGPVTLQQPAGPPCETSKRTQLTELAAILATHPNGVSLEDLEEAMWPGKAVTRSTRVTALSKLRRWLGTTEDGEEYLPSHATSPQLRPEVTTDWDHWHELLPEGAEHASTEALTSALSLVEGRPISGVKIRRYAWAESLRQEMITAIVDAAYQLARRHLMAGRWLHAQTVAAHGLDIEPGWEPLWRIRLMAAHGAGNADAVEDLTGRLLDITDDLGSDLDPKTEDLLEQLRDGRPPAVGAL